MREWSPPRVCCEASARGTGGSARPPHLGQCSEGSFCRCVVSLQGLPCAQLWVMLYPGVPAGKAHVVVAALRERAVPLSSLGPGAETLAGSEPWEVSWLPCECGGDRQLARGLPGSYAVLVPAAPSAFSSPCSPPVPPVHSLSAHWSLGWGALC